MPDDTGVDASVLGRRSVEKAGDDEGAAERKADRGEEGVCRDRRGRLVGDAGQHPKHAEYGRRDGEPSPQPHARQPECRRRDHGKIDVECPIVRLCGRHQERRHIGADEAEPGEHGPMHQRGGERQQGDDAEQHEGEYGRQELVERIGAVDGRVGDGGAGRRVRMPGMWATGVRSRSGAQLDAAQEFAGSDQQERQQRPHGDAQARAEIALLDGIADQEDAAERELPARPPRRPIGCRNRCSRSARLRRRGGLLRLRSDGRGLVLAAGPARTPARRRRRRPAALALLLPEGTALEPRPPPSVVPRPSPRGLARPAAWAQPESPRPAAEGPRPKERGPWISSRSSSRSRRLTISATPFAQIGTELDQEDEGRNQQEDFEHAGDRKSGR